MAEKISFSVVARKIIRIDFCDIHFHLFPQEKMNVRNWMQYAWIS